MVGTVGGGQDRGQTRAVSSKCDSTTDVNKRYHTRPLIATPPFLPISSSLPPFASDRPKYSSSAAPRASHYRVMNTSARLSLSEGWLARPHYPIQVR